MDTRLMKGYLYIEFVNLNQNSPAYPNYGRASCGQSSPVNGQIREKRVNEEAKTRARSFLHSLTSPTHHFILFIPADR